MLFANPAAALAYLEAEAAADGLILPDQPGTLAHIDSAVPRNEIAFTPGMARLVALHDPPMPTPMDAWKDSRLQRRCNHCQVGWRGTADDLCWCCGTAGAAGAQSLGTGCGHEPSPHIAAKGPNTCTPPCPCEALTQEPPPCP